MNTYKDPLTGATTDYGVVLFPNTSIVTDFWGHYNLSLIGVGQLGNNARGADFKSGTVFPAELSRTDPAATASNLTAYIAQLQQYPGLDLTWDIPYPVPEDLLISFGDFARKHDLSLAATYAAQLGQGMGNVLDLPTIFVLKAFDVQQVSALLQSSFLTSAESNTQVLYDKVQAELGSSVFLQSHVKEVKRSDTGVEVSIECPSGTVKLIKGAKLVVTVPPLVKNLSFLDLDEQEKALYGKFNHSYYWNSIVINTGLPDNETYNNVDITAPSFVAAVPSVYTIQNVARIPGTFQAYFGSTTSFTDDEVKAEIIATIGRIRKGLGLPDPEKPTEIVALNNHSPFHLHVSRKDVSAGFYRQWQDLQGHKRTWWNGAATVKPASYAIWNFTETVLLPQLLQ